MPHYEDDSLDLHRLSHALPDTTSKKFDGLHNQLIQLKSTKQGDPKDQTHRALELFKQAGLGPPRLNEYMSVPQQYTGLTRSLLTQRASLKWLALATAPHATKSLPSWVIDFNHITEDDHHWHRTVAFEDKVNTTAVCRSATRSSVYDERRDNITNPELTVHGSIMSTIQAFVEPSADADESLAVAKWLICLQECFLGTSSEKIIDKLVGAHQISQLRLAIEADEPTIIQQQRKNIESVHALIAELGLAGLHDPNFASMAHKKGFKDFGEQDLHRARFETFFVTNDGDAGFCFCSNMEVEDVVTLVKGCDNPLILRPDELEEGVYTLVGMATIEGMMDSEAWPEDVEDGDLEELILA